MQETNLTQHYTDGDYDRIGTIKKGADVVYEYVRWVLEDHTRTLVEKMHQQRIEELQRDICAVFGLLQHRTELGRYFIVNAIKAARDAEEAGSNIKGWTIFNDELFNEMYSPDRTAFQLVSLKPQDRCMYAGVFMSELTEAHPDLPQIDVAAVVGADPLFMHSVSWENLLAMANVEDTDFVSVGRALVQLSPIGFDGTPTNVQTLDSMFGGLGD